MKNVFIIFLMLITKISVANAEVINPSNNEKDSEIAISNLLNEKLKIKANLKVVDDKGEDLRVASLFTEDSKKNLPRIAAFVDTKIIRKDDNGNTVSQVISIFSTAEIKLNIKERLRLLEWANSWNSNILPIRIQIVRNNIVAATNLVTTKTNPINEQTILSSYLSVIQVWPVIIQSLEKSKLLLK